MSQDRGTRPAIIKAVVMTYDLSMAGLAIWASLQLRYAFTPELMPPYERFVVWIAIFVASCAIAFPLNGLHQSVWRFTALNDTLRVARGIALAVLLFLVALFLINRLAEFPRSTLMAAGPLLWILMTGARMLRQVLASGDWRSLARFEDRSMPAALLVGRQAALAAFLNDASRRPNGPPFLIRGLIEPDGLSRGRLIHGYPILGGPREAERALISLSGQTSSPPQLVVVDPSLKPGEIEALVQAASSAGGDLVRGRIGDQGSAQLSPLDAADLLSRPPRALDISRAEALISGRRVLITGAGGTIGGELTRQVARLSPSALTLIDSSELNLYEIGLELAEQNVPAADFLGDIRDVARMRQIIGATRPDVVLHAAALKHVPLMEKNPSEAVLTNVLGTINVAEAARDAGAGMFVLISSDKAVNPTNVMGASKRAAEAFVQALDAEGGPMRATAVRFGNVLGSTGSVVPLFERQIARGGPITVTDKEITRFFMTVQEAAALVLQAAALADRDRDRTVQRGRVFVLDMGEPVRIDALARQLCRLRGVRPDIDVQIVYTGLRPGEKLYEDVFYEMEQVEEADAPGVLQACASFERLQDLRPKLDQLTEAARRRDREIVFETLRVIVPRFTSNGV